MKFRGCIVYLLIGLFAACSHEKKNNDELIYFEKEVTDRIAILQKDAKGYDPAHIHKQVDDVILLSKDVENMSAAVQIGNALFKKAVSTYSVEDPGFEQLSTSMHVDRLALVVRQNELKLLNQLLFKSGYSDVPLHPVTN